MKRKTTLLTGLLAVYGLCYGDGTIFVDGPGAGGGWTYVNNVITITGSGTYVLTGGSSVNRVAVGDKVRATITLDNVHIASSVGSALWLSSDSVEVTLRLVGRNELISTHPLSAGLTVGDGSTLSIEGTGSLYAEGGGVERQTGGAGIGGGDHQQAGVIVIESGEITAQSVAAAGIGSGSFEGSVPFAGKGRITINGGTVTAMGGAAAAGIGGGVSVGGGTIIISEGTVSASGGSDKSVIGGAGIGSGAFGYNGGTIAIRGGTVTATGGYRGAGIGGGSQSGGGTIALSGGQITASARGIGAAGIGGGENGYGGNINISGGTVLAFSHGAAISGKPAGIGGGWWGAAGNINITGGTVYATGNAGPGIGAGEDANTYESGNIRISGGTVIADEVGDNITTVELSGANTLVLANSVQTTAYGEATVRTGNSLRVSPDMETDDDVTDVLLRSGLNLSGEMTLTVPDGILFDFNHQTIYVGGSLALQGSAWPLNSENVIYGSLQKEWTLPLEDQIYTGTAFRPNPDIVTYKGERLKENTNYTLRYSNNVAVGTATVRIVGIDPYLSSYDISFHILPNPISKEQRDTFDKYIDEPVVMNIIDTVIIGYDTIHSLVHDTIHIAPPSSAVDTIYQPLHDTLHTELPPLYDTIIDTQIVYKGVPVEVIQEIEVVNTQYIYVSLTDATGAEPAVVIVVRITSQGADLLLEGLQSDKPFAVYTVEGRKYFSGAAPASGTYCLRNLPKGLYLLEHNGRYNKFLH